MTREETSDAVCPFCGERGFDLVGLKLHLTGANLIFSGGCEAYENAEETNK